MGWSVLAPSAPRVRALTSVSEQAMSSQDLHSSLTPSQGQVLKLAPGNQPAIHPLRPLSSFCNRSRCSHFCKRYSTSCSINTVSFWNSLQLLPFPTLHSILAICWAGPHGNPEPVCLDHHLSPVPGPEAPSRHSHVPTLESSLRGRGWVDGWRGGPLGEPEPLAYSSSWIRL